MAKTGPNIAVVFTCSTEGMRNIMRFWEIMEELMDHNTIDAEVVKNEPD